MSTTGYRSPLQRMDDHQDKINEKLRKSAMLSTTGKGWCISYR